MAGIQRGVDSFFADPLAEYPELLEVRNILMSKTS